VKVKLKSITAERQINFGTQRSLFGLERWLRN